MNTSSPRTANVVALCSGLAAVAGARARRRAHRRRWPHQRHRPCRTAETTRYTGPATPTDPTLTCATARPAWPPGLAPGARPFPAGSWMAAIVKRGHLIAGVDQNTYQVGLPRSGLEPAQGLRHRHGAADRPGAVRRRQPRRRPRQPPCAVQDRPQRATGPARCRRAPSTSGGRDHDDQRCSPKRMVDFSSVYYCAGQAVLVPASSTIAHRPIWAASASARLPARRHSRTWPGSSWPRR